MLVPMIVCILIGFSVGSLVGCLVVWARKKQWLFFEKSGFPLDTQLVNML